MKLNWKAGFVHDDLAMKNIERNINAHGEIILVYSVRAFDIGYWDFCGKYYKDALQLLWFREANLKSIIKRSSQKL